MKLTLNVHDIIRIPGRAFEDLTLAEVALMIEADSSISPEGNEYFAGCALDEFLHNTRLKRQDLKAIQEDILNNIYIDIDGSKEKIIDTDYLVSLVSALRSKKDTDREIKEPDP